jgi:type VI secretion system protein VasI
MKKIIPILFVILSSLSAYGQRDDSDTSNKSSKSSPKDNKTSTNAGVLAIGSKELAKCAAIDNQVLRLICYDELAKKYNQVATSKNTSTTSKGRWKTSTDKDPLTDKIIYYAQLTASEGRGKYGDRIDLLFRCKNGEIDAYVNWSTFLSTSSISVTSRIDKNPAKESSWSLSTDYKASFIPQPEETLEKFIGASSFVVNVTPYSENPITAIFNITGAEKALSDIRRSCPPQVSSTSVPIPFITNMVTPLGGSCKYSGDCSGTAICQNSICVEKP